MRQAALRFRILLLLLAVQASAQSTVHFGVLGLFHPRELELSAAGSEPLRIAGLSEPVVLNREPGQRGLLFRASGDRILVSGIGAARLDITSRNGSPVRFQLTVPGKLQRVYQGSLHVSASHGTLVAIVSMDREIAVATIVASEMPTDAPLEALKAQAVVTRSFIAAGPRHAAFDFCDTTHCQYLRSPDEVTPKVRTAVEDTHGLVLTWRSQVIAALYSSRCGDRTRSLQEAGINSGNSYPYYAVPCAWCHNHPLREKAQPLTATPVPGPGSRPSRIAQNRQWGWSALPGNDSPAVDQNQSGLPIEPRNAGHDSAGHPLAGHGFGLCQFGAIGMAAAGADYPSILAHYYPNTELAQLPPHAD